MRVSRRLVIAHDAIVAAQRVAVVIPVDGHRERVSAECAPRETGAFMLWNSVRQCAAPWRCLLPSSRASGSCRRRSCRGLGKADTNKTRVARLIGRSENSWRGAWMLSVIAGSHLQADHHLIAPQEDRCPRRVVIGKNRVAFSRNLL